MTEPKFGDIYQWNAGGGVYCTVMVVGPEFEAVVAGVRRYQCVHVMDGTSGLPQHKIGALCEYQLTNPDAAWRRVDAT